VSERGSVKAWVIATVIALPSAFAALVGIGCALGANACPFGSSAPFTTTDGREIWLARCAACHGVDAAGSDANPEAPSLVSGPSATLTMNELVAKIADGEPFKGMPRFEGVLSEQQIDAVAAYVEQLRKEQDG
jgi:mono/diheme cytochrome c family protein